MISFKPPTPPYLFTTHLVYTRLSHSSPPCYQGRIDTFVLEASDENAVPQNKGWLKEKKSPVGRKAHEYSALNPSHTSPSEFAQYRIRNRCPWTTAASFGPIHGHYSVRVDHNQPGRDWYMGNNVSYCRCVFPPADSYRDHSDHDFE